MDDTPITPDWWRGEAYARIMRRSLNQVNRVPPLLLDLSAVGSLTGGGLGELVALHNRLRDSGGRLVLCRVGPAAYDALDVTGLTTLFEVRLAD